MTTRTAIEWTGYTWNPVVGCTRVSPGCAHCYAKELHDRRHRAYLAGKDVPSQYAEPFERVQLVPARLGDPLRWRTPRLVFVNSVSDLFHDDVPDDYIAAVFGVMAAAERHTFQVLTKRPARMRAWLDRHNLADCFLRAALKLDEAAYRGWRATGARPPWPLPNVWLGVSVENQRFADERIPLLLQTPAAVRFLSCEPLLGPVQIPEYLPNKLWDDLPSWRQPEIDWVIAGGESGPKARPVDVQWIRNLVAQCRSAGVPVFVKQLGSEPGFRLEDEEARGNTMPGFHHYDAPSRLYIKRLSDRKGGDPSEWPEELRVREMPRAHRPAGGLDRHLAAGVVERILAPAGGAW